MRSICTVACHIRNNASNETPRGSRRNPDFVADISGITHHVTSARARAHQNFCSERRGECLGVPVGYRTIDCRRICDRPETPQRDPDLIITLLCAFNRGLEIRAVEEPQDIRTVEL